MGKTAYSFGYLIFYQEPEADTQAEGQDVTVIVHEEDSVYDVGVTLQEKGLIERPVIFWAQEKLSDYRGKIKPGTYLLNTHETVDQMLAILSGKIQKDSHRRRKKAVLPMRRIRRLGRRVRHDRR